MEEEHKNEFQPSDDEWLTRALRARSQAEARPGLEERILARLGSEPEINPQRRWKWVPALAVAFGVLVIAAVGWEFVHRNQLAHQEQARIPQAMQEVSPPRAAPAVQENKVAKTHSNTRTPVRHVYAQKNSQAVLAKADALPKLDRFPAETPASEQERLIIAIQRRQFLASLAQYARDFRQTNDLIIEKNSIPPLSPETADENPNR